jgi:hypothetical protein
MNTQTKVDWSKANCIGIDTDMFIEFEHYREARRVCSRCPIAADCFYEAVKDDLTGTWGGLWHGKPATPGVRVAGKGDVKLFRYYRAVLVHRLGITLEQFVARYGQDRTGIRTALQAARR